jgi:2'-5' RNA ligase
VQIDSPHIHNAVAEIQKDILERQGEHLSRALVPTSKLHLTLALLHLNGDGDEESSDDDEKMGLSEKDDVAAAAAEAAAAAKEKQKRRQEPLLAKARSTLAEIMRTHIYPLLQEETGGEPPTLRFTGLGSFQERVVFIRPHSEDKHTKLLQKISYVFIQELHKQGLTCAKPPKREADVALHGTIAKMSRFGGGKGSRRKKGKGEGREGGLVRACWEAHEHWSLVEEKQSQLFEKVQLLEMRGNADGSYYEMVEEYAFVCAAGEEGGWGDLKKGAEGRERGDDNLL